MISQKKEFKMLSIRVFLIVWAMFFPRLTSAFVSPEIVDFGDVVVNTSSTIPLYITNFDKNFSITVFLVFKKESNCDFSVEPDNLDIQADQSERVDIHYTPTDFRECSDYLRVFCGINNGEGQQEVIDVLVQGTGIEDQNGKTLSLLEFFDESVEAGTLTGYGPGKSGDKRLNALRNMIVAASKMIESKNMDKAYGQLEAALKKIDVVVDAEGSNGSSFAAYGGASTELARRIREIMDDLL